MTTPPDDPRADEGLVEALREISRLVQHTFDGVIHAPLALDAIDDVAKAALAAARSHGGM